MLEVLKKIYFQLRDLLNKHPKYFVFGSFILLILFLNIRIISKVFGSTGEDIRHSAFVRTYDYVHYTNPKRGTIYASDGRVISMEVPCYKLSLDFQADILSQTKSNRYKHPDRYRIEIDSLDDLMEEELDSLANLICKRTGLGRKYHLNRSKLRRSWRKGKNFHDEDGRLRNREIPMLALDPKDNPKIDWATYQELLSKTPFKPILSAREQKNRPKTGKKVRKRRYSLVDKMHSNSSKVLFERSYPFGRLANATIGTCEPDRDKYYSSHGRSGLEIELDSLLRGRVGHKRLTRSCQVTIKEDSVVKAEDGCNIYTTLDMNMQNILHSELEKQLLRYNALSGHAILLDVKTGAIKAMVNLDRKYIKGKLTYVEEVNHAVQDRNEPGSTIKPASMMIALEDGVVRPNDLVDTGHGPFRYKGATIQDWGSFGQIEAWQIIQKSSNVGIAKVITSNYWTNLSSKEEQEKSYDKYVAKLKALAFDYTVDIPLPLVNSPKIRSKADWDESAKKGLTGSFSASALSSLSYGYTLELPSIYIAGFYNAIANGGKLMKPYLIEKITKPLKDGSEELIQKNDPVVVKEQIASPRTITEIKKMLRSVVEKGGTATRAFSKEIALSGKTGTAKVYNPKTGRYFDSSEKIYRVSFASFFPSDDPKYTCFILLDRCDKKRKLPIGGGAAAAPVALAVAKRLIPLGKPSSIDLMPKKDLPSSLAIKEKEVKVKEGIVPKLKGLDASTAIYYAHQAGFKVKIDGLGLVESQNLPVGKKYKKGTTIHLKLK